MSGDHGLSLRSVSWWRRLWQPFWALPSAIMVSSLVLGLVLPWLEHGPLAGVGMGFNGQPSGARSVLSTVSSAMISVTGLVFSVTMVVLQLASSQFSPRVLRTFLDGRLAQVTLGVFIGSFTYSLTVLRSVRDGATGAEPFVPRLSVSVAYLYVLASVALFLAFINLITSSVQVSRVISDLGAATLRALQENSGTQDETIVADPDRAFSSGWEAEINLDARHGYLVAIDADQLIAFAEERDAVLHLDVSIGDFLVPGQHVGRLVGVETGSGSFTDDDHRRVSRCLEVESDRVLAADPLFGTRQLVDIAERALSPGINDPTTARQVVNELHLILRVLSTRPDPAPMLQDESEVVRLTVMPQTLAKHLELAVTELMGYGHDAAQVPGSVTHMLAELREHALPAHRTTIEGFQRRTSGLACGD